MSTLQCIGLLLVAPLFISFTATATRIFCRAPPVFEGDPANLTCHFPEDLSQSKKSVSVYGRDVNGSQAGRLPSTVTPSRPDSPTQSTEKSLGRNEDGELVIGCVWGGEKLVCDANEGFTLLPQKIDYEITFGIPSHKPGTFRCDYIPPDKAVTVQSCNLTLKGRPPSTVTPSRPDSPTQSTERSLGRNEDGDRPVVNTIVFAVVLLVIAELALIYLIVLHCRPRLVIRRVHKKMVDAEREPKGENQALLTDNDVRLVIRRVHKKMVDVEREPKGENQAQFTDNDVRSAECSSPLFP